MIYESVPANFNPSSEVVSCFARYNGHFLNLLRQDGKPEANRWGVPAGKIDLEETMRDAMRRELWEETGLDVYTSDFNYFKTVYVKYPKTDFVFHMFDVLLSRNPIVVVNPQEHKGYVWLTPEQALQLPLVRDMDACIKMYFGLNGSVR